MTWHDQITTRSRHGLGHGNKKKDQLYSINIVFEPETILSVLTPSHRNQATIHIRPSRSLPFLERFYTIFIPFLIKDGGGTVGVWYGWYSMIGAGLSEDEF